MKNFNWFIFSSNTSNKNEFRKRLMLMESHNIDFKWVKEKYIHKIYCQKKDVMKQYDLYWSALKPKYSGKIIRNVLQVLLDWRKY